MSATSHALRERRGSLSTKVLTFVLTVVLALSLLPVVPAVAADAGEDNTVTLTIVAGGTIDFGTGAVTDHKTWVNKKYAFNEGDTVVNLLARAKQAGDIEGYDISNGMLNSITSKEGEKVAGWTSADSSSYTYWSLGVGGGFASNGVEETYLEAGQSYQLGFVSSSSIPTSYDWEKYYESNNPAEYEGEEQDKGIATLTIVGGVDTNWGTGTSTPVTWVNKKYAFNEGDTVVNLLARAKQAGDIEGYDISNGMLNSITSKEGEKVAGWTSADSSSYTYWSLGVGGGFASNGVEETYLEAGQSYQLGYTFGSSVPTSYDWDAYYENNEPGAATNEPTEPETPGSTTDRPSSDNVATGIDENELGELMDNIAKSYAGTTDPWKVLALSALGMQGTADLPQFVEQAVSDIKNPPQDGNQATAVQRYITALSAAGYDATALPDGDGTYNAVEKMAQDVTSNSNVNVLLSTLWAYASGDYEVPDGAALSEQALVNKILDAQHADGGFAWSGSGTDADMTAMAISALVPYEGTYPGVTDAVNRALSCLQGVQQEDGGFANSSGDQSCNTTASVVIALCAAGLNPATQWATANGSTPLSALLSYAASDLSGFVAYAGDTSVNDMATEQGFMALVAYEGLLNSSDGSYNLYAQAREHSSSIPDYTPNPKEEQEEELVDDAADEGSDDATQTGDSGVGALALAAAIAMLATFVAGSIAHRRRSSMERGE